jgi:uncharacterized membrane protein YvlD (DUF360 family)
MFTLFSKFVLASTALMSLLPLIRGIDVKGTTALLVMALTLSILIWATDQWTSGMSQAWTDHGSKQCLKKLIPIWLAGFFVVPAILIKVSGSIYPGIINVSGWQPAVFGGLVVLLISLMISRSMWGKGHTAQVVSRR